MSKSTMKIIMILIFLFFCFLFGSSHIPLPAIPVGTTKTVVDQPSMMKAYELCLNAKRTYCVDEPANAAKVEFYWDGKEWLKVFK